MPKVSQILNEAVPDSEVWNALIEAAKPSTADADAPLSASPDIDIAPEDVGGEPTAGASPPVGPTVTGWLLEGLCIEGFRGVNNQGQPLELKFYPHKVNSLSAVNGIGKSSIYDAVRYAITGKLTWLDALPAADRAGEYYLNRFNTSGKASIKLKLLGEPCGERCEITVVRDSQGARFVSATGSWDAEAVLRELNREFVFLDSLTFQKFISDRPIDRGRTFSGLLGLSIYSELRQHLAALANTRAFNNFFQVTAVAQAKAREERAAADALATIKTDYEALVGSPCASAADAHAQTQCVQALAQIGPLATLCQDKALVDIDIDACLEAVKLAEGGPKRERLGACIRERAELNKLNLEAPKAMRAADLAVRAAMREEVLAKTAGDLMLQLYQTGAKVLNAESWIDPKVCPLCNCEAPHDLRSHLADKLTAFTALDDATTALAVEWGGGGWAVLAPLEAELEPAAEARLIARLMARATQGLITQAEAVSLAAWLQTLRSSAQARDSKLAKEQTELEKELPPSSVEVAKKIEAMRRLQGAWRQLAAARVAAAKETEWETRTTRIKRFLDAASTVFAGAEAAMSKARLTAVEPILKTFYKRLWFVGVEPAVTKRSNSEELQLRLADFHGINDVSPQALLSESSRNAFAISLYLAAASLYGGRPKFIVLDDVTSSFDAGHQNHLVELIRTSFARPGLPTGLQTILLSHDTMLEKLFNRHSNSGGWWHQRLEGSPQVSVLLQSGAVNNVRDRTNSMLQAGQVDSAKEGVRQYLEYKLSDMISRLRIPVPLDVAFNDNKQLGGEFLSAIEAAVKLHRAAGSLILDAGQQAGLNANMASITGNFLSHWGTGQTLSFTGGSLLGVMQAIYDFCQCFTFEPNPGATRLYLKTLDRKQ